MSEEKVVGALRGMGAVAAVAKEEEEEKEIKDFD